MPNDKNGSIIRFASAAVLILAFALFGFAVVSSQNETRRTFAVEDLRVLKLSVEAFRLRSNELPLNVLSLESSGILKKIPVDPWGNNYRLVFESTHEASYYAVFSAGGNGNFGTVSFPDGVLSTTDPDDIGKTNAVPPGGNNNWQ